MLRKYSSNNIFHVSLTFWTNENTFLLIYCWYYRYWLQLVSDNLIIWLAQHRDTQETLAVLDRLDLDTDKPSDEEVARKFGFEEDYYKGTLSWWQKLKPKMWSLFDEPYSSNAAKVCPFLCIHFILNVSKTAYYIRYSIHIEIILNIFQYSIKLSTTQPRLTTKEHWFFRVCKEYSRDFYE